MPPRSVNANAVIWTRSSLPDVDAAHSCCFFLYKTSLSGRGRGDAHVTDGWGKATDPAVKYLRLVGQLQGVGGP